MGGLCPKLVAGLLLLLALPAPGRAAAKSQAVASEDPRVHEMLARQAAAPDGVVHLTTTSFGRLLGGKARPYTVILFLTAEHLREKPALRLDFMREEFGYLAKAFKASLADSRAAGKLFFADVEFSESREVVHQLGIQAVPFMARLGPATAIDEGVVLKLRVDDLMQHFSDRQGPWTAEDMAAFVQDKTGVAVGKITRPTIFTSPLFPPLAIVGLCAAAWTGLKLYTAPFMRHLSIYIAGSLFVYWFSVSGGMHNFIRGMPLYILSQDGVQMWINGSGQLGAEGFIMGTGYLVLGGCMAALTYAIPRMSDTKRQRFAAYGTLALALLTYSRLMEAYRWKTNHRWRTYF